MSETSRRAKEEFYIYVSESSLLFRPNLLFHTWAVHKETELFFVFNLLLHIQRHQTCLLQSTPLRS